MMRKRTLFGILSWLGAALLVVLAEFELAARGGRGCRIGRGGVRLRARLSARHRAAFRPPPREHAAPRRSARKLAIETARRAGVAGGTDLIDFQQQRIAVAIDPCFDEMLRCGRTFRPCARLPARTRPVGDFAGLQRLFQRLAIHPGEHQHRAGRRTLRDDGHEPVVVERDRIDESFARQQIGHDAAFMRAKACVEIGDQIVGIFKSRMDADSGPSCANSSAVRLNLAGTIRLS